MRPPVVRPPDLRSDNGCLGSGQRLHSILMLSGAGRRDPSILPSRE